MVKLYLVEKRPAIQWNATERRTSVKSVSLYPQVGFYLPISSTWSILTCFTNSGTWETRIMAPS